MSLPSDEVRLLIPKNSPQASLVKVETHLPHQGFQNGQENILYERMHLNYSTISESPCNVDPGTKALEELHRHAKYAVYLSLAANVILFLLKLFASFSTVSMAIIASTVDSALDLVSQCVICWAQRGTVSFSAEEYPVGRNKLEPLGVILCASLMGSAALLVLFESSQILTDNLMQHTTPSHLTVHVYDIIIMGSATLIKAALFCYCNTIRHLSPSALALAEDHRNDVVSNTGAICTAFIAWYYKWAWWTDEIGAILICAYIIYSWIDVAKEHIEMVVGKAASEEFVQKVTDIANTHHTLLELDMIRAYHFGTKFLVELEVVMAKDTILKDSHDCALSLQRKVEALPTVERAFVHVDYQKRVEDEHKNARLT